MHRWSLHVHCPHSVMLHRFYLIGINNMIKYLMVTPPGCARTCLCMCALHRKPNSSFLQIVREKPVQYDFMGYDIRSDIVLCLRWTILDIMNISQDYKHDASYLEIDLWKSRERFVTFGALTQRHGSVHGRGHLCRRWCGLVCTVQTRWKIGLRAVIISMKTIMIAWYHTLLAKDTDGPAKLVIGYKVEQSSAGCFRLNNQCKGSNNINI